MGGVSVAVAIAVGLVSSFIQSLGLTIQRKSHVQNDSLPLPQRRKPIRRPLWLLGFGIYITSNIFSTIFQLDALPIVILAPLGAVSLIYNALLARLMLGDVFGKGAIVGTGLVAGGAVLIAVFGVVEEREHSLDELLRLFGRKAFVGFFSVEGFVIVVALGLAHVTAWSVQRQLSTGKGAGGIRLPDDENEDYGDRSGAITPPMPHSAAVSNYASPHDPSPIPFRTTQTKSTMDQDLGRKHVHFQSRPSHITLPSSPTTYENGLIPSPVILASTPTPAQAHSLTLAGLAFAAASGVLSGMSLILAKAAVELLVLTLDWWRTGNGENQFVRGESWVLVGGLVVGALLQLVYLNYSLTFASPALICPLAFCFFNLSSIFDGLVFYDQFGRLAVYQIILVSLGVLVLLVGVWVVSAVQPTGQGGVDMGTWVEEEDGDMEFEQTSPLFRQYLDNNHTSEDRLQESPTSSSPPSPLVPYSQPQPQPPTTHAHTRTQLAHGSTSSPSTPTIYAPGVFDSPSNPESPLSPTTSARRRRRTRYGTLVPDLPQGAPTGFSIGLGAASPGFVLRPAGGSFSIQGGGRGRSRSEDVRGIQAIMRGEHLHGEEEGVEDQMGGERRDRRQSWFGRIVGSGAGKKGKIRLDEDEGGLGDGGGGDGD